MSTLPRNVRTLSASRDEPLEGWVRAIAAAHGLTNLFNVSAVRRDDGTWHATFRAEDVPGARPFRAYWAVRAPGQVEAGPTGLVDLSAVLADDGIARVADPKLLDLAGDVYVTFNTGFVRYGHNELYLMRLTPDPGRPWRCVVDERRAVEKNWAFYARPDGGIGAVYEATPRLVLLAAGSAPAPEEGVLRFVRVGAEPTGVRVPLSIGAQLETSSSGVGRFVLHQKWQLLGKRIYCGRMARFEYGDRPRLTVSPVRLVHSLRRVVPPLRRHNPNLLSATYFAGVVADADRLVLTYGINDLDFGIARVREDALWP